MVRGILAGLMVAAAATFGTGAAAVATLGAGVASADDAPSPPDPAPPDPFAAVSEQTKTDPAAALVALPTGGYGGSIADLFGQGVGLTGPSPVDPLAGLGMLLAQNYRMPSGEEPSPYVLQTDVPPGPFARLDAWKGTHALAHGSLGRMPGAELGQPLPGTAPPAGTNGPAGLEQFYVDPATVPPPDAG